MTESTAHRMVERITEEHPDTPATKVRIFAGPSGWGVIIAARTPDSDAAIISGGPTYAIDRFGMFGPETESREVADTFTSAIQAAVCLTIL